MRSAKYGLLLLTVAIADGGIAQTAAPDKKQEVEEIVVEGRRKPNEPDLTNSELMVVTGSRVMRRSLQNSPHIASATTFAGLTPDDSGVDAFKNTRTRRWKSCKVSGAEVTKVTACALVDVDKAFDEGNYRRAQSLALAIAQNPKMPIEDRFVTQSYLYRIAEAIPDRSAKRRALTELVASGLLAPIDELSAVRALASMAFRDGDKGSALALYQRAGELDPDDAQVRINAAAILQNVGRREEARLHVREAVSIAQRNGKQIPRSWLENSR